MVAEEVYNGGADVSRALLRRDEERTKTTKQQKGGEEKYRRSENLCAEKKGVGETKQRKKQK